MKQGVTLREVNCCPHPQHLCIGKGSALLGWGACRHCLYLEQSLEKSCRRALLKTLVKVREGRSLCDTSSNKQKGKPARNLTEPRKRTARRSPSGITAISWDVESCAACIRLYPFGSSLNRMWGGLASIPQATYRSISKMWKSYWLKGLKHNLKTNTD